MAAILNIIDLDRTGLYVLEVSWSFITTCLRGISMYLTFLSVLVEIRFLTGFFLNVNPYFEPFVTLWAWTNPIFTFGRRWYPRAFGIDLTALINYKALSTLIGICNDIINTKFDPFLSLETQNVENVGDGVTLEGNSVTPDEIGYLIDKVSSPMYHLDDISISNYLTVSNSILKNINDFILY